VINLNKSNRWIILYFSIISIWGLVFVTTFRSWIVGAEVLVDELNLSFVTGPLLAINLAFLGSTFFIFVFYFLFYGRVARGQANARNELARRLGEETSSGIIDGNGSNVDTKMVYSSERYFGTVSIIIPARNEESVIADTIQNCLSQTYRNIEVIVVCHNCSDHTYDKACKVVDSRVHVHELITRESGKGIALNYGVDMAKGELLLILDSDGKLNKSFIEDALPMLKMGDNVAAIQGRYIPSNRNYNFITRMLSLEGDLWSTPFMTLRSALGKRTPLGGTGYIIKKEILGKVGGFANHLVDDYELTFRLLRNKYRILFAPLSVNFDEKPPTLDIMIKQRARWVRGFLDLMKIRVAEPKDIFGNLYWINPLSAFSGLALLIIAAFSTVHYLAFHYYPFSYSYISISTWTVLTAATYGMYVAVLCKQYGVKEGLRYAAWLPLYLPFSNYYMVISLKAFFVKSWADTKTTHGFAMKEETSIPRLLQPAKD
jgi:cellulose synthase/poly-beta-1,6-N-acetylglucosamine synthase-like glycosyltransferase